MEFVKSLPYVFKSNYYKAIDTLEQEFSVKAPFEKGKWHWRSIIVLVGIGCSLTTFLLSLFQSSSLLTILTFAITAILCMAIYFVSRYEEQRKMANLLGDFEKNNSKLETEVTNLEEENTRLEETREKIEKAGEVLTQQVSTLEETQEKLEKNLEASIEEQDKFQKTNTSLSETLEKTKEQEQKLKIQHDEYVRVNEKGAQDIQAKILSLTELDRQQTVKTTTLENLTTKIQTHSLKLGSMREEVANLTSLREQFSTNLDDLKEQITLLEKGLKTGSAQQTDFSALLSQLKSIIQTGAAPTSQTQMNLLSSTIKA